MPIFHYSLSFTIKIPYFLYTLTPKNWFLRILGFNFDFHCRTLREVWLLGMFHVLVHIAVVILNVHFFWIFDVHPRRGRASNKNQTRDVFPAVKCDKEGSAKVLRKYTKSHFSNFEYGRSPDQENLVGVCYGESRNSAVLRKCSKWNLKFKKLHPWDQMHYFYLSPNR